MVPSCRGVIDCKGKEDRGHSARVEPTGWPTLEAWPGRPQRSGLASQVFKGSACPMYGPTYSTLGLVQLVSNSCLGLILSPQGSL